ncbi:hypothetical protein LBMAG53_15220 [Planctomycetota bacterium]|nr:hypothetical protein LBMAG53_15220 [Planctomycetota bacterium]
MTQRRLIPRRGFLRGAGALALALPWLESLASAVEPATDPHDVARNRRFVAFFLPNGVEAKDWWSKGDGAGMELSPTLQPLDPHRADLNVVAGLFNPNALTGEQHVCSAPIVLSGARAQKETIRAGVSIDQVIAAKAGMNREFPSLVLGIESAGLGLMHGWPLLYSGHVSWSDATTPIPRENNPRSLFDRLVGDPAVTRRAVSVLDLVQEDARSLAKELSAGDRTRMDQYLTQVREIEVRLGKASARSGADPVITKAMPKPPPERMDGTDEHVRLMIDLIAIALQSGKTNVVTMMFGNDLTAMDVAFAAKGDDPLLRNHHELSHKGGPLYQQTNHYFVSRFADLIGKLKSVQEGEHTLLDNSCLLFCSNLMQGGSHDRRQMPMLLAGKAGGGLRTGRSLNYLKHPDEQRQVCGLYLGLLRHFDINVESFGDSKVVLDGI